jgi:tRNA A37 methylthiotransferase MiaB
MEDDVPTAVKQDRNRRLLAASERVQTARLRGHLGATRRVFVESESDKHPGTLRGRTEHGLAVRFRGAAALVGGEVPVRIEEASAFGLAGSPVDRASARE